MWICVNRGKIIVCEPEEQVRKCLKMKKELEKKGVRVECLVEEL